MIKFCKECQSNQKFIFGDCQRCEKAKEEKDLAKMSSDKKDDIKSKVHALWMEYAGAGFDDAPFIAKRLKLPVAVVRSHIKGF